MTDKPKPSPRIYLATRHRAWWYTIPRWERSKIVNAALDGYRQALTGKDDQHEAQQATAADRPPEACQE